MAHIIIIDDDEKLLMLMQKLFIKEGFQVTAEATVQSFLSTVNSTAFDLIIMDVMMPEMDGFALLETIRKTIATPVLMLTACGSVDDKVKGLQLGADDYLPKPFDPRELIARVNSLLRRATSQNPETVAPISLDEENHRVLLHGTPLSLSETEYQVLTLLVKNSSTTVDRDTIMETLKGVESRAFDRSIDITISRIRKKIGDNPRKPIFLRTIYGEGYMFVQGGEQ